MPTAALTDITPEAPANVANISDIAGTDQDTVANDAQNFLQKYTEGDPSIKQEDVNMLKRVQDVAGEYKTATNAELQAAQGVPTWLRAAKATIEGGKIAGAATANWLMGLPKKISDYKFPGLSWGGTAEDFKQEGQDIVEAGKHAAEIAQGGVTGLGRLVGQVPQLAVGLEGLSPTTALMETVPGTREATQKGMAAQRGLADVVSHYANTGANDISDKTGISHDTLYSMIGENAALALIPFGSAGTAEAAAAATKNATRLVGNMVGAGEYAAAKAAPSMVGLAKAATVDAMLHKIGLNGGMDELLGFLAGFTGPSRVGNVQIANKIATWARGATLDEIADRAAIIAKKPMGSTANEAIAKALNQKAGTMQEAADGLIKNLEAKDANMVTEKASDGSYKYGMEDLSKDAQAARAKVDAAADLKKKADTVMTRSDLQKLFDSAAQTFGNIGFHTAQGAAIGAGFAGGTAPTGRTQEAVAQGGTLGGLLGLASAPFAARTGMLNNRMREGAKALIDRSIKADNVEGGIEFLSPAKQAHVRKIAGMLDSLGQKKVYLHTPDDLREAGGLDPNADPGAGFTDAAGNIHLNVDELPSGVANHEYTHTTQKFFGEVLRKLEPDQIAEFEKLYGDALSATGKTRFNSAAERDAEIGRMILNNTPVEYFYGGETGGDIIKRIFSGLKGDKGFQTWGGWEVPFRRSDVEAMKSRFFKAGERAAATEGTVAPPPVEGETGRPPVPPDLFTNEQKARINELVAQGVPEEQAFKQANDEFRNLPDYMARAANGYERYITQREQELKDLGFPSIEAYLEAADKAPIRPNMAIPNSRVYGWMNPEGGYIPNEQGNIHEDTIAKALGFKKHPYDMQANYERGWDKKYLRLTRESNDAGGTIIVHYPEGYGDISRVQKRNLQYLAEDNGYARVLRDGEDPDGTMDLVWQDPKAEPSYYYDVKGQRSGADYMARLNGYQKFVQDREREVKALGFKSIEDYLENKDKLPNRPSMVLPNNRIYGWLGPKNEYLNNNGNDIHEDTIAKALGFQKDRYNMTRNYEQGWKQGYLRLRTTGKNILVHYPEEYGEIPKGQRDTLLNLALDNGFNRIFRDDGSYEFKRLWQKQGVPDSTDPYDYIDGEEGHDDWMPKTKNRVGSAGLWDTASVDPNALPEDFKDLAVRLGVDPKKRFYEQKPDAQKKITQYFTSNYGADYMPKPVRYQPTLEEIKNSTPANVEPWERRFQDLLIKEDKKTWDGLTPEEQKESNGLYNRAESEFGSFDNWYKNRIGQASYMPSMSGYARFEKAREAELRALGFKGIEDFLDKGGYILKRRDDGSVDDLYGWLKPNGSFEANRGHGIHEDTIQDLLGPQPFKDFVPEGAKWDEGRGYYVDENGKFVGRGGARTMDDHYQVGFQHGYIRLAPMGKNLWVHWPEKYGPIPAKQFQKIKDLAYQGGYNRIWHDTDAGPEKLLWTYKQDLKPEDDSFTYEFMPKVQQLYSNLPIYDNGTTSEGFKVYSVGSPTATRDLGYLEGEGGRPMTEAQKKAYEDISGFKFPPRYYRKDWGAMGPPSTMFPKFRDPMVHVIAGGQFLPDHDAGIIRQASQEGHDGVIALSGDALPEKFNDRLNDLIRKSYQNKKPMDSPDIDRLATTYARLHPNEIDWENSKNVVIPLDNSTLERQPGITNDQMLDMINSGKLTPDEARQLSSQDFMPKEGEGENVLKFQAPLESAALEMLDGTLFPAPNHLTAWARAVDYYGGVNRVPPFQEGFVTTDANFVPRAQAREYGQMIGQLPLMGGFKGNREIPFTSEEFESSRKFMPKTSFPMSLEEADAYENAMMHPFSSKAIPLQPIPEDKYGANARDALVGRGGRPVESFNPRKPVYAYQPKIAPSKDFDPNFVQIPPAPDVVTQRALAATGFMDKVMLVGAHRDLPQGTPVDVRIDIPAYNKTGQYVQTIHAPGIGGVQGYDSIVRLDGPVTFGVRESGAAKVMRGEMKKYPMAVVEGLFNPSRKLPVDINDRQEWTPAGFNPKTHSFFYDKETGTPVTGGSQAVMIGNTAYVKDAKFGNPEDFLYSPTTASEARGNSERLSLKEWLQREDRGRRLLSSYQDTTRPMTAFDQNWEDIKKRAYQSAQAEWGGETIDPVTGKNYDPSNTETGSYAVTVRNPNQPTISVPENATQEQFNAAMDRAKEAYGQLEHPDHYLGVFHDNDLGRIDFDPVLIADSAKDAQDIGAYTGSKGGAFTYENFQGEFAPHVPNFLYMPSSHPDAIKSAAVKTKDGKILTGPFHSAITDFPRSGDIDGYVTNSGEFLDRRQAFLRAKQLNQLSQQAEDRREFPRRLMSENLAYMPKTAEEAMQETRDNAAKYPEALPLDWKRDKAGNIGIFKDKKGRPETRPVEIQYDLDKTPLAVAASKGLTGPAKHEAIIDSYVDPLIEFYNAHKDNPDVREAIGWYRELNDKLRTKLQASGFQGKELDEAMQLFTQLLAGTSPNTNPLVNFGFAMDAWNRFYQGDHDALLKKFTDNYEKLLDGTLKHNGKPIETLDQLRNYMQAQDAIWEKTNGKKGEQMFPRQTNGKKYGMHSWRVLYTLAGAWEPFTEGLKMLQFAQNLAQTDLKATIDLWAARTMHRLGNEGLVDQWRILPANEKGIVPKDFNIAQQAFGKAAEQIGITPDDLQAMLWFAEKLYYDQKGWSRYLDKGDFRPSVERMRPTDKKGVFSMEPYEKK